MATEFPFTFPSAFGPSYPLVGVDFEGSFPGSFEEFTPATPATPMSEMPIATADAPAPEEVSRIQKLNDELLHGDLITRAMAADDIASLTAPANRDWIITVCDKWWGPAGSIGDDTLELTGADPRNAVPSASLKIKGSSEYVDMFTRCTDEMVGVIIETGGIRMPFYVDTFDLEWTDKGWTGTANLLGIYDILNFLQVWPNFPAAYTGPDTVPRRVHLGSVTVIETMISECTLRIQSGLWEFVNNALSLNPDFRAWFGTLLQSNGNIFQMLKTPVYVVRTNPLLDTSPLVAKTVRMESCGTVIQDLTKAYGVDVSVDLWLPGDEQPDFWTKTIPFMALDMPTYVVTVKDRSQIEGPTKTVLDSVIRTVVDAGGSFFGEIPGIVNQVPGMSGVFESPLLGVNFVPPWTVLIAPDKGQKGSIENCKISHHTQKGWQHIVGGRSPKWLNDLMNATYAWLIDSISILIGISGIPSNLLEGFLNNAFLAFQLIESYGRRDKAGPYHPNIEVMHATASSPYNIETVFAFINALWDSRGYISAQATFRNGVVYKLGKDVFKGALVSVLYHGRTKLFTDYIEVIHFRLTPTERDVLLQIGDGKAEEAPLAKHQRFLTGVFESISF
jgi:hypothetical protein